MSSNERERPGRRPKLIPPADGVSNVVVLPASLVVAKPPQVEEQPTPAPVSTPKPSTNGYYPTDKQRSFLATAQACIADGKTTPMHWTAEHNKTIGRPRVELSEFKEWKRDARFAEWFYGETTYEPDEHDLALLRGQAIARISDGVAVGDARLIKEAVDVTGIRKRAVKDAPKSVGEELARFRAAGTAAVKASTGLEMDDEASG